MPQPPADLINVPPELLSPSDDHKYLGASHKDRWEHLKPVIIELYTGNYGKNNKPPTITQIVSFMRNNYSFHAAANEYPHRFRAWGVSDRRVTKARLNEIALALDRRPGTEMSTSKVTLKRGPREEKLDVRRVKRHLQGSSSSARPEAMQYGWLSSWTLPYAAFVSALPRNPDSASPYGTQPATPGYLRFSNSQTTSPCGEGSDPSPNTQLLLQKARDNRTSLFLQGRLKDLIVSMNQDDRKQVQAPPYFYMHGFLTAKNWGSPPSIVNVRTPSGFTPSAFLQFPSSPLQSDASHHVNITNPPTNLCRWSIHVEEVDYEPLPDQSLDLNSTLVSFPDCLHESISTGDFTELRNDNLPLSHETIVHSLTENPIALELDSWKLAIMAGNSDLLLDLRHNIRQKPYLLEEIRSIYPYHLAASYLNGGGPCCTIFASLDRTLGRSHLLQHNINDFGHTILDSLLVSVLRSHTSVHPEIVSDEFRALSRFPGEEKDICGRWDADSSEVRGLFAQGYARIPTRWKHPFCHSAIQAVCHGAMSIFGDLTCANINCPSGLFIRRCTECGIELKLGPLHTLVATAFFLGQSGMAGETLFGPLAILVCLVNMGVNVRMRVNMSIEEILRTSETGQCRHRPMTAAEMMRHVPASVVQTWSDACQTGWDCLLLALCLAETHPVYMASINLDEDGRLSNGYLEARRRIQSECGLWDLHRHSNFGCTNKAIGLLWAMIQAEMLTYRRLKVNDPWISNNFQMLALHAWLKGETEDCNTPLVSEGMIKAHSKCGWFLDDDEYPYTCPTASDVSKEWFANVDDYERATFVNQRYFSDF
ncbi:unnamed protein product [Fusarium venenatum]|uniref:Clr5 domain-containing protein n=1 Tax=Fusarium venenatum TaxID=56646 RepID=A0A2L2T0Y3_9HYPO|nr:uncharacterized protein FVRRES_07624 [Fusarium venenatum]CEI63188.1 unnamed protein product [Fusarium venenatum]